MMTDTYIAESNCENNLTHSELLRTVSYDPDTGVFRWLVTNSKARGAGKIAGGLVGSYMKISINKQTYPSHHLAWFYVYGRWPKEMVDHINNIKTDNRISNLRESTAAQNACNLIKPSKTLSGFHGVYWNGKSKAWWAGIKYKKKNIFLGYFLSKDDAMLASSYERFKLFGDFASNYLKDFLEHKSKEIKNIEEYLATKRLKKGKRGRVKEGSVNKKVRKSGSIYYVAASKNDGLTLGRFESEERARIAVRIYAHFWNLGYRDIPRTMSVVI